MIISQLGSAGLQGATITQPLSQAADIVQPRSRRPDAADVQSAAQGFQESRRKTLSILSREIRAVLAASFRIGIRSGLPAYSAAADPQSAADVAGEALRAGKAIAGRAPLDAGRSLDDLRKKVEDAAEDVRELVGDDDDDDLEDVMSQVKEGLDDLDDDAARNVASSASVLSYESRLKQRSTIRIRTQEGDIVRFDLRRVERMSATDVAVTDGNASLSSTEVELSSRTRMVMSVRGDLNEGEFAAIQNVFAKAEAIAGEFFGGDLAKAFNMAAGIEFDTEQLARVKMRFRERLDTALSFASLRRAMPEAVALPEPRPAPVINKSAIPTPQPVPVAEPAPEVVVPDVAEVQDVVESQDVAEPAAVPAENAIDGFLNLLSDFLRSVNEGFELNSGSSRYFYSQSFKLEVLKAVLQFSAPEELGKAADNAAAFIDPVAIPEDTA